MVQFLLDIWWVLGDILEFACRVGIMICIIMFMLSLLGVWKPGKAHEAAALPRPKDTALPISPTQPRKPLPRSSNNRPLP